jgi:hypothetical protein
MFLLTIITYPFLPVMKLIALVVLTCIRLYRRSVHSYHWFDTISDQIMIGGAPIFLFHDDDYLEDQRVTGILNICPESPPYDKRPYKLKGNFLFVRVFDRMAPTMKQLEEAVFWLDRKIRDGEKVLIHCAFGAMRSAMVLAAWYVFRYRWSVDKTLKFLKTKRPQMHLNDRQLHRLREWEERVRSGSLHAK